jgi:DNA-binding response OmpR family regulator
LDFLGFSNPDYWQLERLLGTSPDLMVRANALGDREKYRLIELLDPDITHYEFFLAKPPLMIKDWLKDEEILEAIPEIHPCLTGWPSRSLFDYNYQPIELTETEFLLLKVCADNKEQQRTVKAILASMDGDIELVRDLHRRQLLLIS